MMWVFFYFFQSIRRTHRQNYEAAQQKLQRINQRLSMLKKRPNTEVQDEINMNYNKYNNTNINSNTVSNYSPNNNNINLNHSNISGGSKFSNANNINNNNNGNQMERRNSTISSGSSSQQTSYKPRSRCDSYSGIGIDYSSHSGKLSPSNATPPYYTIHPTAIYSSHNHLADKVAYVTNAVAAAAAAAAANFSGASTSDIQIIQKMTVSPKYGRLRNPLTVDTNSNHIHIVQQVSQTQKLSSVHSPHQNRFYLAHNVPQTMHLDDDSDDDDIAGQYATLLTVTSPSTDYNSSHKQLAGHQQQSTLSRHPSMSAPDNEPQYSVIMSRGSRASNKNLDNETQLDNEIVPQSQGLGGYWMTLENNERVWCTLDNKYVFFYRTKFEFMCCLL